MNNELIDLINNILPPLVLSPLAAKTVQGFFDVIKVLYEPRLIYRKGRAEINIKKYEKVVDGDIYGLNHKDLYEVQNYMVVTKYALDELNKRKDEDVTNDETVALNWMLRFFDTVRLIDDKDLQVLFGKIMAGEVRRPGACSFRTLSILMDLQRNEAINFNSLCKFVVRCFDTYFIFMEGFNDEVRDADGGVQNKHSREIINSYGLNYEKSVSALIEAGLFNYSEQLYLDLSEELVLSYENDDIEFLLKQNESDEESKTFCVQPLLLTKSGVEVFNSISMSDGYKPDIEYTAICLDEICKQHDIKYIIRKKQWQV